LRTSFFRRAAVALIITVMPAVINGANILNIPVFARGAAMSGAFYSVSEGSYGLFYNPAGMLYTLGFESQISYVFWLDNIQYGHFALINPDPLLDWGKIGIGFSWFSLERPSGTPHAGLIDWEAYPDSVREMGNYTITLGGAVKITKDFSAGVTIKLSSEYAGEVVNQATGFDIGLMAKFPAGLHILKMGAIASSTGPGFVNYKGGLNPPLKLNAGLSDEFYVGGVKTLIAAAVSYDPDNIALFRMGVNAWFFKAVSVAAGLKIGEYLHPTAGFGFKYKNMELHYAFEPYENLGSTHMVSFLLSWWTPPVTVKANPELFSAAKGCNPCAAGISAGLRDEDKITGLKYKITSVESGYTVHEADMESVNTPVARWDGRREDGAVEDGYYDITVEALYITGEKSKSPPARVEVDSTGPSLYLSAEPQFLRPGERGALLIPSVFSISAYDKTGISGWKFIVTGSSGKEFYTAEGKGEPPAVYVWDGRGNDGSFVETGNLYYYMIEAGDTLGNVSRTAPRAQVILLREIRLTYSSDALFNPGETSVKSDAYRVLKDIKPVILRNKDCEIYITGHTDGHESPGVYKTREALSKARAEAVRFYMINLLGIKNRKITAEGLGDSLPASMGSGEKSRGKNRRVEVLIKSTVYE